MYKALGKLRNWGPEIVGNMTMKQQLMYLEDEIETDGRGRPIRRFDNLDDWNRHKAKG